MSIATELTRIALAKEDLKAAITEHGVDVPDGAMLEDMPDLVRSISGGDGAVRYDTEQSLTAAQQKQARLNIGIGYPYIDADGVWVPFNVSGLPYVDANGVLINPYE